MLSDADIEKLIRRAIALYNRTHSPEVAVKLVFTSPAALTVLFTGGLCYSCSVLEYVEGFAHQFKALTDKAELKAGKTRQINPRTFEADYIIKIK
jgi:hypothetical protein